MFIQRPPKPQPEKKVTVLLANQRVIVRQILKFQVLVDCKMLRINNAYSGGGAFGGKMYMKAHYRNAKAEMVEQLKRKYKGDPIATPVVLYSTFFYSSDKSLSGYPYPYTDVDSPSKGATDVLVQAGILKDDRFIIKEIHEKAHGNVDQIKYKLLVL